LEPRVPGLVEQLHHAHQDGVGVRWLPGRGLVHQQTEGRRQVVFMRVDVVVDAASIVLKIAAVGFTEVGDDALGGFPDEQYALHAVVLYVGGPEYFRHVSGGHAAGHVHLPESVLRGDVALRDEEVIEIGGLNVRHSVAVAAHRYGGVQAMQLKLAVKLWKRCAHVVFQPDGCADHDARGSDGQCDDGCNGGHQHRMPGGFVQFDLSSKRHVSGQKIKAQGSGAEATSRHTPDDDLQNRWMQILF